MADEDDCATFVRGDLLGRHGIRSGAGFPVSVGRKVAAVIELLSFDRLERDAATEAVAGALTAQLQAAAQRHWADAGLPAALPPRE